jgi:hypothetical protein
VAEQRIIDAHRRHFGAAKRDAAREVSIDAPRHGSTADDAGGLASMLAVSMTTPSQALSRDAKEYHLRQAIEALPPEQRANTDLVVLWEGADAPCAGEPAGAGARYIKMSPQILAQLKATKLAPAAYRMRAVNWWLSQPDGMGYGWVGVLDTDLLFQSDLFDQLYAIARPGSEELHLISESPFEFNDGYTNRRLHSTASCDLPLTQHLMRASILSAVNHTPSAGSASSSIIGRALRGARRGAGRAAAGAMFTSPAVTAFWRSFGRTHRLNFGSMFGTRIAMMAMCEEVVAVLVGPMSSCWDQGMLNVLVWTGLLRSSLPASTRIVVWDCFAGPVKTLDVGGLRDEHGRWYNERGALYALVHQFRKTRQSAFYASLELVLPSRTSAGDARSDALYPYVSWNARVLPRPMHTRNSSHARTQARKHAAGGRFMSCHECCVCRRGCVHVRVRVRAHARARARVRAPQARGHRLAHVSGQYCCKCVKRSC